MELKNKVIALDCNFETTFDQKKTHEMEQKSLINALSRSQQIIRKLNVY